MLASLISHSTSKPVHFQGIHDIRYWARYSAFEIVLIALGAVLAVRIVHWLARRAAARIEHQVRRQVEHGLVPSEQSKHLRVLVQAGEWVAVVLLYFIAAILILVRFKLPLATLIAPATVAGVAIGFGAQRVVQDLLSGFFIFAERQYGFGDVVRIGQPGSATGISGTVEEVTLRTTKLRTVNGELVIIPNGEIRQATNLSQGWSRVVVDIPLAPEQDVDLATELLEQIAKDLMEDKTWSALLLEEPTVTGIEAIQVGYLQLRILARTLPAKQWDVGREIRRRIIAAFRAHGVAPPQTLYTPATVSGP
ncbi:MAG: mechanosensitive ion channel family protein [Acidimicrobiales bacterium]